MKIRAGFVSNSSSSSFLIYGTFVDTSKLEKLLEKMSPEDSENDKVDPKMYFEERADKLGLDAYSYCGYDCGGMHVGMSWSSVKDDETGKQFKERVQQKIRELFGEDVECYTSSEAWYDG